MEDLWRELEIRALIHNSVGADFSIYRFDCLRRLQYPAKGRRFSSFIAAE